MDQQVCIECNEGRAKYPLKGRLHFPPGKPQICSDCAKNRELFIRCAAPINYSFQLHFRNCSCIDPHSDESYMSLEDLKERVSQLKCNFDSIEMIPLGPRWDRKHVTCFTVEAVEQNLQEEDEELEIRPTETWKRLKVDSLKGQVAAFARYANSVEEEIQEME